MVLGGIEVLINGTVATTISKTATSFNYTFTSNGEYTIQLQDELMHTTNSNIITMYVGSTPTTLNWALSELGETMASNLTTQGVTSTASEGLTTLAGKILNIETDTLTLTSNKSILSYADSETATLTGTSSTGLTGLSVSVYNAVTGTKIGDMTDNEDGTYSYTYNSTGVGDISMTCATSSSESNSVLIEDCLYYNTAEIIQTSSNSSTLYDNNMSIQLPTNCEISFDECSLAGTGNKGQHRFFIMPKNMYNSGTTQPQSALWFDNDTYAGTMNAGTRTNNGTTYWFNGYTGVYEEYYNVKFVKQGTSISFYWNNQLWGTNTVSWIDDYSNYTASIMRWSAWGTTKMKNVKIKAL